MRKHNESQGETTHDAFIMGCPSIHHEICIRYAENFKFASITVTEKSGRYYRRGGEPPGYSVCLVSHYRSVLGKPDMIAVFFVVSDRCGRP